MMSARHAIATALVGVWLTGTAAAQDSLAVAESQYANAQYEEALATLNRLRATGLNTPDVPPVEQYRALCLLALGRAAEAEDAIAAVITAMPSYAPPDRDVSPRVRSAFHDVRRRVVPGVVQQRYGEAKSAFERKDYAAARDGFAQVITVLDDPGLSDLVGQPPLADLVVLAKGFHDLSVTSLAMAAPSPAPGLASTVSGRSLSPTGDSTPVVRDPRPDPPAPRTAPDTPIAPSPSVPVVYSPTDADVVPPVTVRQSLPPYPRKPLVPQQGVVEVVIDERGAVETATMRRSVDLVYDSLALAAARTWQYKPAMRNGVPVKFRKGVQIRIEP